MLSTALSTVLSTVLSIGHCPTKNFGLKKCNRRQLPRLVLISKNVPINTVLRLRAAKDLIQFLAFLLEFQQQASAATLKFKNFSLALLPIGKLDLPLSRIEERDQQKRN